MHLPVLLALALASQSPPAPSAQAPVGMPPPKSQPPASPPMSPPPAQGRWQWVAEPPPPPVQAPPPAGRYVWVADQPIAAPGPAYAIPAPVQTAQQVAYVTAQPPTTIQFGGGLLSAGLTRAGQCLVHLGSTRTTITLQRTSTRVGMPAPTQTAQYTTTYQVPVQQPTVQIVQPPYQPVAAPPPAQPPSEQAPPPPPVPVPQPSGQSGVPAPRRLSLFH
jgi:hypothetical protein